MKAMAPAQRPRAKSLRVCMTCSVFEFLSLGFVDRFLGDDGLAEDAEGALGEEVDLAESAIRVFREVGKQLVVIGGGRVAGAEVGDDFRQTQLALDEVADLGHEGVDVRPFAAERFLNDDFGDAVAGGHKVEKLKG